MAEVGQGRERLTHLQTGFHQCSKGRVLAQGPAPKEFDNPYLSYEIGQDHHTRWDANPFKVFLEWYGLDESTGYVFLGNHLFGNGGKIEDLRDIFRKAFTDQDYRIVERDPRTGLEI